MRVEETPSQEGADEATEVLKEESSRTILKADLQEGGYYMNVRSVFNPLVEFAQPRGSANFPGLSWAACAWIYSAFKCVLYCKTLGNSCRL